MSGLRRVPVAEIWYRVPSALRALVLIAMWFSYAALLSNLNSLDDGGRTAEIIWGACAFGTAITALVDLSKPACFASLDEFFAYRTALRTGDLPGRIDVRVWRCHLRRSRIAVALAPAFFLPYLAFGALSADSSQSPHRVLLLWAFVLSASWVLVATIVQGTRIKQLESLVRQQQKRQRSETPTPASRAQQLWKSNAEASMAERVISTLVASSVVAFLPLLLADLDAVVYSDARGTHLTWAACAQRPSG